MQKVITFANHKGGVGKTTSVASVGAALATMGYKTLLVDLDAQANLTGSLLQNEEQERTIYNALKERKELPVVSLRENLSICPSSLELAGIELELSSAMSREFILKDLLESVASTFDVILLDCPPSLGLIAINAFVASTDVIIPLTAEALPFKGLMMIEDILEMVKKRLNPALQLSGIALCRWEGRKLNKMVEEALRDKYGEKVFATRIRTNIAIAEAPLSKEDIYTYAKDSNGAADYKALTEEILQKIVITATK
jgi:chromosome partitioning protein